MNVILAVDGLFPAKAAVIEIAVVRRATSPLDQSLPLDGKIVKAHSSLHSLDIPRFAVMGCRAESHGTRRSS